MARILLINPSYTATYGASKVSIVNPVMPTLGLATIAGEAIRRGHHVSILDLSYRPYDWRLVRQTIAERRPDIIGITATTPLMNQLRDISVLCKDISRSLLVVGGGAHISALPIESMQESMLDLAMAGEADLTFGEVCDGTDPKRIAGLYYRDGQDIRHTGLRPVVSDLDELAMPAWHLYDPSTYRDKMSRLLARRPPVTMAEFSRGCVFKCDFCASKMTMALGYRKKSPRRCAEEVKAMHRLGWREFMLADDIFSSDNAWAASVSEEIIHTGLDMAWSCTNGIRVESANARLFQTMRRAGCYRVSFGFESGNDAVLRAFGKGGQASLAQGRSAVRLAMEAGIDTSGFFLLGLSADTEETMQETIAYARALPLDMLKFGITIAFPGTPMFNDYVARGLIRSFNWDDYHIYTDRHLFVHPVLDDATIIRFMRRAYRETIQTNPRFIVRRIRRGIKTGEFFWDAYYFLRFIFVSAENRGERLQHYYAKDRWPGYEFTRHTPAAMPYQRVTVSPALAAAPA